MTVPVVNIVIEQGTDYQTIFSVNNSDGTPSNLTGYSGVAKIRKFSDSTSFTSFTVGIGTTTGKVTVSLANTVTASLNYGRHYYDVIITSSVGKKTKIVDGMVMINASESI